MAVLLFVYWFYFESIPIAVFNILLYYSKFSWAFTDIYVVDECMDYSTLCFPFSSAPTPLRPPNKKGVRTDIFVCPGTSPYSHVTPFMNSLLPSSKVRTSSRVVSCPWMLFLASHDNLHHPPPPPLNEKALKTSIPRTKTLLLQNLSLVTYDANIDSHYKQMLAFFFKILELLYRTV